MSTQGIADCRLLMGFPNLSRNASGILRQQSVTIPGPNLLRFFPSSQSLQSRVTGHPLRLPVEKESGEPGPGLSSIWPLVLL